MRAGIVAIFFFAALLAVGHYIGAPFFCRGGISIPTLDPRALCGADMHLNQSGSVLFYFVSIVAALIFGAVAGMLPGKGKKAAEEPKKEDSQAKAAETFEQIVAAEEKKAEEKKAEEKKAEEKKSEPTQPVVAHPSALAVQSASTASSTEGTPAASEPAAAAAAETPPAETPGPPRDVAAAAQAAIVDAIFAKPAPAPTPTPPPAPVPVQPTAPNPETAAKAEAITVGLAATKSAHSGPFDGTNQELVERFRELRKNENVNSIAQAQRLLDESTLSALGRGIDPKQHLSDVAHLVLTEDPDLKSGVVRGVVVHIAARLKELGVVQKIPSPAKPAA